MKKLAPGVVRAIRNASGPTAAIAREFELAISTVDNIRRRLTYAEVPDEPPPAYQRRKLTDEQVRAIRKDIRPLRLIAKSYGVSTTTVSLLQHREQIYLDVE